MAYSIPLSSCLATKNRKRNNCLGRWYLKK